jgi:CheY-like chemotaxis protein
MSDCFDPLCFDGHGMAVLPKHRNVIDPHRTDAPHAPLVLVVEDQEASRKFLVTLLSIGGYRVLEASNGREALAHLFSESRPDVILLDLVMPVMDGWEFLDEQQKDSLLRTIPTIVVSGVPSNHPRCLDMPPVRFLPKPYTVEQLIASIEAECSPGPRPTLAETNP